MLGRLLAALAYVGLTGALVPLAQPDNLYVIRHARRGIAIHILRVTLIAPVLALPLADPSTGRSAVTLGAFARDLSLLVMLGIPGVNSLHGGAGLWMLACLVLTWGLQFLGFLLAVSGLTADLHAFLHADWPNFNGRDRRAANRRRDDYRSLEDKESLAQQREQRLARVRAADSVAASERRRQHSLGEMQDEFAATNARRAHLTKLLALGEITERRYAELLQHLDSQLTELNTAVAILGARRLDVKEIDSRNRRELPTLMLAQVPLQTLAISARSGIPLFTYGTFHLDEALVTGILSAFNSLSEEVFGAQVHKTQLAEGQVLYFVHAPLTVTMAVFDEEPSPVQLSVLRDLVGEFERLNARELNRTAPNPACLHEITIPFSFVGAAA